MKNQARHNYSKSKFFARFTERTQPPRIPDQSLSRTMIRNPGRLSPGVHLPDSRLY